MKQEVPASPVSLMVNVARLPQKGMPIAFVANERQRAALAEAHELLAVTSYAADLVVTGWKRRGVRVAGVVKADITQACIVTLEPIEARIEADIDQVFLPDDSKLGRQGFDGGGEILLDAEGPDGPETFSGDSIDVGALGEEFFGLAIDPYPRKAGATLPDPEDEPPEGSDEGQLRRKLRALIQKT